MQRIVERWPPPPFRITGRDQGDCVFIDGRIAAGPDPVDIEKIVRDVYAAAGYGGPWNPDPGKIRVTTELCEEVLPAEESDIRPFSDDQNIVIGYACGDRRTNYLPVAHWVSGELGRRLFAQLRADPDLSATFGPDFGILASLEAENNTIENMECIFKAAKAHGFEVFISPHYFYPTDKGWKFNGPLETDEATSGMFARSSL